MTERYRVDDQQRALSYVFTYNGIDYPGTGPTVGLYRRMSDRVTPGFAKRRARGDIIISPMSSVSRTVSAGMLSLIKGTAYGLPFEDKPGSNLQHISCKWTAPSDLAGSRFDLGGYSDVQSAVDAVCTRVRSQIGRSPTQNWENLAEVNKTVEMLRHPLDSWFRFSRKARLATAGLSAANAWLAYRYGVRPLVSSVDGTLKELRKQAERSAKKGRVSTRASAVIRQAARGEFVHDDGTYLNTIRRDVSASHEVRAVSLDEVTFDMSYTLGLGSKDLLTLPWELVPYSFVVDWFVNVGDYLGALSQSFYPKSLGQCYTIQSVRSEYRETLSHTTPSGYTIDSQRRGWIREDIVWKDRYPGLRGPSLVIQPSFRLDNVTRLADAFALAGQQLLSTFSTRRR